MLAVTSHTIRYETEWGGNGAGNSTQHSTIGEVGGLCHWSYDHVKILDEWGEDE